MKRILFLALSFTTLLSLQIFAQTPTFSISDDVIYIGKDTAVPYILNIKCIACDTPGLVSFKIRAIESISNKYDQSSIIAPDFENQIFTFKENNYKILLYIKYNKKNIGDSIIYELINIDTTVRNFKNQTISLVVKDDEENPKNLQLDSMRYRLMIGTNFDFINGRTVNDLYYHLQVFQPNAFNKILGFIGGIQQNRTFTQKIDGYISQFNDPRPSDLKLIRTPEIERFANDSFKFFVLDHEKLRYTTQLNSTVFTIYLEPTCRFINTRNNVGKTELFALLHFDAQRITNHIIGTIQYGDNAIKKDIITTDERILRTYTPVENGAQTESTLILYHYNFAAGSILHHENKYIDLYAKFLTGIMRYKPTVTEGMYSCEIGLRIPSVNIMLGAEYRGIFKQKDPLYFNMYLSKVFGLNKIAEFLTN